MVGQRSPYHAANQRTRRRAGIAQSHRREGSLDTHVRCQQTSAYDAAPGLMLLKLFWMLLASLIVRHGRTRVISSNFEAKQGFAVMK